MLEAYNQVAHASRLIPFERTLQRAECVMLMQACSLARR